MSVSKVSPSGEGKELSKDTGGQPASIFPIGQVQILQHVYYEKRSCDQHGDVHETGEEHKPTEVSRCSLSQKTTEPVLILDLRLMMWVVYRAQVPGRDGARSAGDHEQHEKPDVGRFVLLPEAQQGPTDAQCQKTDHGHDSSAVCEVRSALVRVEKIGNETVPGGCGEMIACKVTCCSSNDEPRPPLREQPGEQHDREPHHRLSDGPP